MPGRLAASEPGKSLFTSFKRTAGVGLR